MPMGKFPGFHPGMRHGHIDNAPYFRFWCQKTLPALYDDSLSYYDLLTNVVWYINQLITVAKAYDEKFAELEGLYIELEHYVATYFDKMNVEQTLADILDDMAYSGRLAEILCNYLNDYSIDAKKIKNGFIPVHYEFVKCDENHDYYKRDLTDKEIIEALRNGSILLGIFNGSPQFGNFIMFHDTVEYDYNGKTVECKCGCSCDVLVQDYTITYREAMANKNAKLVMYIVTDAYCQMYATGYYGQMYADVEDGSITTAKLADGAVTTPKIADGAVTEPKLSADVRAKLNKDDNTTYTLTKSGDKIILTGSDGSTMEVLDLSGSRQYKKFIFIGDSYAYGQGGVTGWCDKVKTMCGLRDDQYYKGAESGSGFIGQSGHNTFKQLLQNVSVPQAERNSITDIIVCGGWNDQGKDAGALLTAMKEFMTYVNSTYPHAFVHVGYIAHQDYTKANGSMFNLWAGAEKYSSLAGEAGMAYIGNSEYILHRWDYFQNDGIHPNEAGEEEIAKYISSYIMKGNVDVNHGYEVISDDITWNSNVEPNTAPIISTWQHNGRCGVWINENHYHFKTPVTFTGHPRNTHATDPSGSFGTYHLFTLPDNSYCQGGAFSGMQTLYVATFKTSGEETYETRPCYVRLIDKDVCIVPISTNEGEYTTPPYDHLENISDVIFQIATVRIEGESMMC